jgi:DNA-binding NtrC family response regulator
MMINSDAFWGYPLYFMFYNVHCEDYRRDQMAIIAALDDVYDEGILIQRILKRKGHTVHPFTEEEEFLSFVKKEPVDLAILDIKLKKLSGVEVLEEAKKVSPGIKAIMLTGFPTIETAQKCLQLGADEYLVKPIDIYELEEKVEMVLGKGSSEKP